MKAFYQKHREIFRYLFFGICTTLIDWAIYYPIIWWVPGVNNNPTLTTVAMAISWTASAIFAFFVYKKWVFEEPDWRPKALARQFVTFIGSRLITLGLALLIAYFGTQLLNNWAWFQKLPLIGGKASAIVKLIQAAVNMVVNYLFSKFVVFRKKKKTEEEDAEA